MGRKIVILGGGPAGMAAAIGAKQKNPRHQVQILEKNNRLGKKLLATGNGRCNFTNIHLTAENYYSSDPEIVQGLIKKYAPEDVMDFLKSIGLFSIIEDHGRVYPLCGQASAVLDCLRNQLKIMDVQEKTEFDVHKIIVEQENFQLLSRNGQKITANALVIASGGKSYENLGSDGSGFKLLKQLGHQVMKPNPALVQLHTEQSLTKGLNGIRVKCLAKALCHQKVIKNEFGEVQFTSYGLSGIPIMNLSKFFHWYPELFIELDFFPDDLQEDLVSLLVKRKELFQDSDLTGEEFLTGMINKKLGQCLMKLSGIEKLSIKIRDIQQGQLIALAQVLKQMPFKIKQTHGYDNAQITSGGAKLSDFHKETLESRIVPGLYAAGEVLDVFGDCGGYNLNWAFASGLIAGTSAGNKGE